MKTNKKRLGEIMALAGEKVGIPSADEAPILVHTMFVLIILVTGIGQREHLALPLIQLEIL